MVFEPSISLGNILTMMGMLVAAIGFMWSTRSDVAMTRALTQEQIKQIEARFSAFVERSRADEARESLKADQMQAEIKAISAQMTQIIRQEERLNNLEARVGDLVERIDKTMNDFSNRILELAAHLRRRRNNVPRLKSQSKHD